MKKVKKKESGVKGAGEKGCKIQNDKKEKMNKNRV